MKDTIYNNRLSSFISLFLSSFAHLTNTERNVYISLKHSMGYNVQLSVRHFYLEVSALVSNFCFYLSCFIIK